MASATAAAAGVGPSRQHGASVPDDALPIDLAVDDLAAVAAAVGEQPGADVSSFHRRQQEELLAMYHRQAAQQQAAARQRPSAAAGPDPFADLDAEEQGLAAVGVALPHHGGAHQAPADPPLDLPEGINLEEARMLEAAMLGIPYEGRIPDFSAAPAAATPLSPGTLEQHAIRREQDQAYEESLALDRCGG